jgi:hypothetical protein
MTIIYIENVLGSGQIVTVAETFRKQTIERSLRPGESGRFLMSPFKSIVVNESILAANACGEAARDASALDRAPYVPMKMTMHSNDD